MDIPQLKLLAGLVRALLEQNDVPVGHSQSLDLIAALPGLRNWPEVNVFPDRVAACELNASSASRLSHRLRSKHAVKFNPQAIVEALSPPGVRKETAAPPQVWPSGPAPGVYVTTSQGAIDALLRHYEEATDGELVYAEVAGSNWEGAIDLGEYGLSSNGLSRVPSGTLIVVGPLELNQESWEGSAHKLEWACMRAYDGLRVAVLLETPQPELLFKDIQLAVNQVAPAGDECPLMLTGIVTEDGDLQPRVPFVQPVAARVVTTADAPTDALPLRVVELLRARLKERSTGFLVLSSCVWTEHWGIDEISAALPLTEFVGPACRVKSRSRSTPAKDMMVPDLVKALPFVSSVESAYAHGYRRMLVSPVYTDLQDLLKYPDVLFFIGSHCLDADEALLEAARFRAFREIDQVYDRLVACVGILPVTTADGIVRIADVFIPGPKPLPEGADFTAVGKHMRKHRAVRWEDELTANLEAGIVTPETVGASLEKHAGKSVEALVTKWAKRRKPTTLATEARLT